MLRSQCLTAGLLGLLCIALDHDFLAALAILPLELVRSKATLALNRQSSPALMPLVVKVIWLMEHLAMTGTTKQMGLIGNEVPCAVAVIVDTDVDVTGVVMHLVQTQANMTSLDHYGNAACVPQKSRGSAENTSFHVSFFLLTDRAVLVDVVLSDDDVSLLG